VDRRVLRSWQAYMTACDGSRWAWSLVAATYERDVAVLANVIDLLRGLLSGQVRSRTSQRRDRRGLGAARLRATRKMGSVDRLHITQCFRRARSLLSVEASSSCR
jgi:hypothetical protein